MRARVLAAAAALYSVLVRRLHRRFPAGAAVQAAGVFDALQREALDRRGWPGLLAYWGAEAWTLLSSSRLARRSFDPRTGQTWTRRWPMQLRHDLRDAWRSLRGAPGYTAFVLMMLALGIGANTAMFSVLDAIAFKPLPFADADRIVLVAEWPRTGGNWTTAPTAYTHWRTTARAFAQLEARAGMTAVLLDGGDPASVRAARVTPGFFTLLGITAAEGRTFTPADADPQQPCVAVISSRLWRARYHANRSAIGQPMRLSGRTCALIGVLPPDTAFDRGAPELYVPLVFTPVEAQSNGRWLTVLGRLADGVAIDRARAELESIAAAFNATRGAAGANWTTLTTPWRDVLVRVSTRQLTWTLFGAVGLVLVIACANIAGLGISRTVARGREIAVRAALGASRGRLFRPFLLESLLLSVAGGAIGIAAASLLLRAFAAVVPAGTLPAEVAPVLDLRVLLFTLAVSVVVGIAAGTLPAWQAGRSSVTGALAAGPRGGSGTKRTSRLQSALLVVELAIAMVLVTGAALLMVTLNRVASVAPGFDPAQVLTLRISAPPSRYASREAVAALFSRLDAAIDGLPGVDHAGAATSLPLGGWLFGTRFQIEGLPEDRERPPSAHIQQATPGYVEALGIGLAAGRSFTARDTAQAPRVAIVNATFVRRFIQDGRAVGRRVFLGSVTDDTSRPWDIVGVINDVKTGGLTEPALATPEIYVPHEQAPMGGMFFAVRTASGDPSALVPAIRQAIQRLDGELAVGDIQTMDQRIGASLHARRFRTTMIAIFAALAALLACSGVYAVRARAVAARRREIGIRVALGATRRGVIALAVGQGLRLTVAGLAIGGVAAVWTMRAVDEWLFQTTPSDPGVLTAAALLLGGAAVVASWVPARRAATIDPVAALRED